jgi:hypothetical protein
VSDVSDIRDRYRFYMTQTTRLLHMRQEGARYLGDPPIIDGRQAIVDGQGLLEEPDLKSSPTLYDNVLRRQEKVVEVFGQELQAATNVA